MKKIVDFYRKHLKKYYIFRIIASKKNNILICLNFLYFKNYKFSYIFDTEESSNIKSIFNSCNFKIRSLKIIGDHNKLNSCDGFINYRDISLFKISNVCVYGKYSFFFKNNKCYNLMNFNPDRDKLFEEVNGLSFIKKDKISLKLKAKNKKYLKIAFMVGGISDGNFAHWFISTAPKISIVKKLKIDNSIPLIFYNKLPSNIKKFILSYFKSYKILFINPDQLFNFDELFFINEPSYLPFEWNFNNRIDIQAKIDDFKFNSECLLYFKQDLIKYAQQFKSKNIYPKKIFIFRNSYNREMIQNEGFLDFLKCQGYSIIIPEKLSFIEQILFFNNATHIVGQAGAALCNCLFMKKETKVFIISSYSPYSIYSFFGNLISLSGLKGFLYLGQSVNNNYYPHNNFTINIDNFKKEFMRFMK